VRIRDLRREILSVLQLFRKIGEVIANPARTFAIDLFLGHVGSRQRNTMKQTSMRHEFEIHSVFEEILPKPLASSFGPRSSAWP